MPSDRPHGEKRKMTVSERTVPALTAALQDWLAGRVAGPGRAVVSGVRLPESGVDHLDDYRAAPVEADTSHICQELVCGRRRDLEERRLSSKRARRQEYLDPVAQIGSRRGQRVLAHWPAVDHESLGEVDQVWGCEPGGAVAGGAKRRVDHRGDRPFPVGACDVHRLESALGMSQRADQRPDVLEPELDPELFEPEQVIEGSHTRDFVDPRS